MITVQIWIWRLWIQNIIENMSQLKLLCELSYFSRWGKTFHFSSTPSTNLVYEAKEKITGQSE